MSERRSKISPGNSPDGPRGLYFQEIKPGQHFVTRGRTITESDIVQFAGLTMLIASGKQIHE